MCIIVLYKYFLFQLSCAPSTDIFFKVDGDLTIPCRRLMYRSFASLPIPVETHSTVSEPLCALHTSSHDDLIKVDDVTSKKFEIYLIDTADLNRIKTFLTEVLILMMQGHGELQVIDRREYPKPSCFAYRTKPIGGSHCLCDGISVTARTMVGRGSFGHAILATICATKPVGTIGGSLHSHVGEEMIFKVDLEQHSVVWEAHIHATVSSSLLIFFTSKVLCVVRYSGV
jgi:hypothetical protein